MKNITLGSPLKALQKAFSRFHMTVFIVLVVAVLAGAVMFLNSVIVASSTADGYTSPIDAGSIDQATLERIRELHGSSETIPTDTLPEGRVNPFGE